MKKIRIIYWIVTGLLAVMMAFSAISNILIVPDAVTLFNHLGYPIALSPFLGVAKLLAAIAIVVPGFPRIKEWAYAGLTYDLLGAIYSFISVGDPVSAWAPILVGLLMIAASYILYHKLRNAAAARYQTA